VYGLQLHLLHTFIVRHSWIALLVLNVDSNMNCNCIYLRTYKRTKVINKLRTVRTITSVRFVFFATDNALYE